MIWDSIFRHPAFAKTEPIRRDPLSIGIAFLVNIGYGGAISALGATLVGVGILGALGLGASLLSNYLFSPTTAPAPPTSDRQQTIRQSVGARLRSYGKVKLGGTLWFLESRGGTLFQGITINEGEIHGVIEFWLNDKEVSIDPQGFVTTAPYVVDGVSKAQIIVKDGDANQAVIIELDAYFPEVGPNHRLRGVAIALAIFYEVPQDKIAEVFPQLNPNLRLVVETSEVLDVRSGIVNYSNNSSNCIYDYLTRNDGAGFPYGAGYDPSEIAIETFQALADISDQPVALKGGGTIPRYTINGSYALNEQMRSVLPRMLATCDADLYLTNDGKIGIRGGRWTPPNLFLDDALGHIITADFRKGSSALAAFNELVISYVDPYLDYQEAEAESWIDYNNLALVGRTVSSQLNLPMVSVHAQARRLGKIHSVKNNPRWSGRIVTNFYGLNAIGEGVIHLKYSPLSINETFLVRKVVILPDLTGVELTLTSLDASAYEWDAELEEGVAPNQPPIIESPTDLPPPDDFSAVIRSRVVDGAVVGIYIRASWAEPERTALGQQVQYRMEGGNEWFDMSVSVGVGIAESGLVNPGSNYKIRIRTISPGGTRGDWSAEQSVAAVLSPTADSTITTADNTTVTADQA